MTTYHGKDGAVSVDGSGQTDLQSWDLTTTADMADNTPMQVANDWQTQRTGMTDFQANIEYLTTSGQNNVTASVAAGALVFAVGDSAATITGTGIPTTLTETVSIDDVSRTTIAYDGNDVDGLSIGP